MIPVYITAYNANKRREFDGEWKHDKFEEINENVEEHTSFRPMPKKVKNGNEIHF